METIAVVEDDLGQNLIFYAALRRAGYSVLPARDGLEAHEARRDGQAIGLTVREFALLRLLMERAGKVVTRAAMLDQVWGSDAAPLTNVVDVYKRHLRTKLDGDSARSVITTVRGAGYKFSLDAAD